MNILRSFLGVFVLAAAVTGATAAFQSARPLPDNPLPDYPPALKLEGITKGRALVALSINAEGRVDDTLVLAYSNRRFAQATLEAVRDWRFAPAQFDGVAVPVKTEIMFNFSLEGAVISANIINHYFFDGFDNIGDNALSYRPAPTSEIDRAPERTAGEMPVYATAAEKDGVRGKVRVRFYIDEHGEVRLPATTADAHPYIAGQALNAVKTWKFAPVTSHGRPVLVVAEQEFDFGGAAR